jgi:hypothetical protein
MGGRAAEGWKARRRIRGKRIGGGELGFVACGFFDLLRWPAPLLGLRVGIGGGCGLGRTTTLPLWGGLVVAIVVVGVVLGVIVLLFLGTKRMSVRRVTGGARSTLGGRPRFRGGAEEDSPAGVGTAFLFLLPLGRPRPRFTGVSEVSAAEMGGRDEHSRRVDMGREDDKTRY